MLFLVNHSSWHRAIWSKQCISGKMLYEKKKKKLLHYSPTRLFQPSWGCIRNIVCRLEHLISNWHKLTIITVFVARVLLSLFSFPGRIEWSKDTWSDELVRFSWEILGMMMIFVFFVRLKKIFVYGVIVIYP